MKTKTLMSKVTLGAALVLTTATVATSVVVNPSVVKADDYVVADKNAEIYTIYDISGYGNVSWYAIFDENGVLYPDLAKLRDYEYTTVSKDGIWSVGPNGEKNWDPNAVKPEPTTPSTTEPTTTDDYVVADKNASTYILYGFSGPDMISWNDLHDDNGVLYPEYAKLRDNEYTVVDPNGIWAVGPNGERNYNSNSVKPEDVTKPTTSETTPSTSETTPTTSETTPTTSETTTATSEKPEDVTKPSTQTTTTTPTKATEESTPSTSETTTATSEKPEDVTKLSTQTTTTTPTKATEEIETLPKTGDASILSMLAGTGILSGLGLTSLKRKFKK
jgi:LPXTG-motif cell wall-anchored protein